LNWRENQVRLKAQLLEIGALIYRRGRLFLEPNTTSTCTRNESRGGLMACDNRNESEGVRDESKGVREYNGR